MRLTRGIVYLVGGGPGDPGLITLRGVECLRQADVVVHDRLVHHGLLDYAPQAEWIDVGKRPDHHPVPQEVINALLVDLARQGKRVVRLKGGDPFVFGRGGEEASALAQAGQAFEIVPGVTSAIAAPAYAGIPLTRRGVACSAAIITGHRADCNEDPASEWRRLAGRAETLVFLMGVHNLPRIVEEMLAGGLPPETPIALVEQATTPVQKTVTGSLADIVERAAGIRPPAVIIVGEVVAMHSTLRWFDRADARPLLGLRVLNTRPAGRTSSRFGRAYAARNGGEISGFDCFLEGFDPFSRQLAALGAQPLELPTRRIAPVDDHSALDAAIQELVEPRNNTTYDWLVFTSANGVDFFFQRIYEIGYDVRILSGVRLAVVGQGTARALKTKGLAPDFIPTQFTAQDLAMELPDIQGKRVLLPRSAAGLPDAVQELERRGAIVESLAVYCLKTAEPNAAVLAALLGGNVDVAAFFSPSSLRGLSEMLEEKSLAEALEPVRVACIGQTTAKAASAMGMRVDIVPEEQSVEGMLEAMSEYFRYAREANG